MKTNTHVFITYRSVLLRMKNVPDKICRENQNNFYAQFVSKMVPFMTECGKIFTVGQATDDNMAHVHTHTHTHTHTQKM